MYGKKGIGLGFLITILLVITFVVIGYGIITIGAERTTQEIKGLIPGTCTPQSRVIADIGGPYPIQYADLLEHQPLSPTAPLCPIDVGGPQAFAQPIVPYLALNFTLDLSEAMATCPEELILEIDWGDGNREQIICSTSALHLEENCTLISHIYCPDSFGQQYQIQLDVLGVESGAHAFDSTIITVGDPRLTLTLFPPGYGLDTSQFPCTFIYAKVEDNSGPIDNLRSSVFTVIDKPSGAFDEEQYIDSFESLGNGIYKIGYRTSPGVSRELTLKVTPRLETIEETFTYTAQPSQQINEFVVLENIEFLQTQALTQLSKYGSEINLIDGFDLGCDGWCHTNEVAIGELTDSLGEEIAVASQENIKLYDVRGLQQPSLFRDYCGTSEGCDWRGLAIGNINPATLKDEVILLRSSAQNDIIITNNRGEEIQTITTGACGTDACDWRGLATDGTSIFALKASPPHLYKIQTDGTATSIPSDFCSGSNCNWVDIAIGDLTPNTGKEIALLNEDFGGTALFILSLTGNQPLTGNQLITSPSTDFCAQTCDWGGLATGNYAPNTGDELVLIRGITQQAAGGAFPTHGNFEVYIMSFARNTPEAIKTQSIRGYNWQDLSSGELLCI